MTNIQLPLCPLSTTNHMSSLLGYLDSAHYLGNVHREVYGIESFEFPQALKDSWLHLSNPSTTDDRRSVSGILTAEVDETEFVLIIYN